MNKSLDFFVEVLITKPAESHRQFAGLRGFVTGKSPRKDGKWSYVIAFNDHEHCYMFDQEELEATGRCFREEDFFDGSSIKVRVDPKTGEGEFVE